MTYNLLIVEDHALTRFGLKTTFENVEFIKQIYEAQDAQEAFDIIKNNTIDIIIMDLGLPNINGLDAIKMIKQLKPKVKFLVLTSHENEDEVINALKAGAHSYCTKDVKPDKLIDILYSTINGALWFDPKVAGAILKLAQKDVKPLAENVINDIYNLTLREKQVLKLMAEGLNNQEIAEQLCVSVNTTKAHVCNILQKLSVEDRTQAAIKALKDNII